MLRFDARPIQPVRENQHCHGARNLNQRQHEVVACGRVELACLTALAGTFLATPRLVEAFAILELTIIPGVLKTAWKHTMCKCIQNQNGPKGLSQSSIVFW